MPNQEKVKVIEEIKAMYTDNAGKGGGVIIANYFGLRVQELFQLRNQLREHSIKLQVLKNTLVRRALNDSGISGVDEMLKGPTIIAFTPDEVSAPKIMTKFAKGLDPAKIGRLEIKGGVLGGEVVSQAKVAELATLPSREEVFASLLALINAPATSLLRLIQEPGARAARLLKAISEK